MPCPPGLDALPPSLLPRRHEAQQRDGLAQYGWLQHDGRGYGLQCLLDEQYNITTAWVSLVLYNIFSAGVPSIFCSFSHPTTAWVSLAGPVQLSGVRERSAWERRQAGLAALALRCLPQWGCL